MSKWIEGKLRDLVEVNPAVKLIKGEIYPFVSMDVIQPFYKPVEAKEEREFKSGGAKFENGDTLFARITPCLENGKIAQVKNLKNGKGFGSTEFIVLRGKEGITDTDFVYYLVTNKSFRENAERLMVGTSGRQRVDKQQFEDQIISIPDLETQKRISSILGSIDKKIELNVEMNKTLEEMAMTLYKHWFVDFDPFQDGEFVESELGMIPKGWEVGCLSDIVNKINDRQKAGEHLFNLPYVPIDLLNKKNLSLSDTKPGSEAKSSLIKFCKDDILFGAMRPYFHKVCIAPFEGITRTTCFVLRPKKNFYFSFAVLTIFRDETINFADSNSKGSTIPYADWESAMANMKIVIPNDDVLYRFDEVVRPMLSLIRDSYYQNKCLKDTRNYLLPRLLSGEIDLSEAKERIQEVLNNA